MPLLVGIAIRYIILAAVQLGIWSLIEKYGLPLLNKAVVEIMQVFGMSEEDAKAVMANEIIVGLEKVGLFAATLRTKMPIKVAEYLGFTSKGFAVRKLSQAGASKIAKVSTTATVKAVTTAAEVTKVAEVVAKSRGLNVGVVSSLFGGFVNTLGKVSIPLILMANVMDFGNWQGAYQKTFQKIFTNLGFPPDSPIPKARTISNDTWTRIYSTIETLNPIGISFPVSNIDKIYSRAELANLIDEIAANLVLNGEDATYKNVIGIALPLIQLNGKPDTSKMDSLVFKTTQKASASNETSKATTNTTKVFTGVISQGVVGSGLNFQSRPDDLIESVAELRDAAANNLAPFLAALPAKVIYEVKVVSSIVTKDGFKQTGTTQRIVSGTKKDGTPTYKNVTNKFATLVLYVLTDKGTRTKISTVVLGPVDSAKLTVGQNDLRELELALPKLVTTSDVNDIKGIETANPITITTPQQEPVFVPNITVDDNVDTGYRFYTFSVNGEEYLTPIPWLGNIPFGHTMISQKEFLEKEVAMRKANPTRWNAYFDDVHKKNPNAFSNGKSGFVIRDGIPYLVENVLVPDTAKPVNNAGNTSTPTKASATTLYEWYQAQGKSVPSVSERAKIYQDYGLGQSTYYTGTAEQNTKLLNALKGAPNSAPVQTVEYRGYIEGNALGVS